MSRHDGPGALGPGEFRALTGLSEKALRLYAERGVLPPAEIDPVTGYRGYGTDQVRTGVILDVLRRAHVPLDELSALTGPRGAFPFEQWRARLDLRRRTQDYFLAVAEQVAAGDPGAFTPRLDRAAPAEWVAVGTGFGVGGPAEDVAGSLTVAAIDVPALDRALVHGLAAAGVRVLEESWTVVSGTEKDAVMWLAHRTADPVDERTRDLLAGSVRDRAGGAVQVATGCLPGRTELTFDPPPTPPGADEGVLDVVHAYLGLLALTAYLERTGARPLADRPRRRVRSSSLFASAVPQDVFDLAADASAG